MQRHHLQPPNTGSQILCQVNPAATSFPVSHQHLEFSQSSAFTRQTSTTNNHFPFLNANKEGEDRWESREVGGKISCVFGRSQLNGSSTLEIFILYSIIGGNGIP